MSAPGGEIALNRLALPFLTAKMSEAKDVTYEYPRSNIRPDHHNIRDKAEMMSITLGLCFVVVVFLLAAAAVISTWFTA